MNLKEYKYWMNKKVSLYKQLTVKITCLYYGHRKHSLELPTFCVRNGCFTKITDNKQCHGLKLKIRDIKIKLGLTTLEKENKKFLLKTVYR